MTRIALTDVERADLELRHGSDLAAIRWAYQVLSTDNPDPSDSLVAKALTHRCGPAPTWPDDTVLAEASPGMVLAGLATVALCSGTVGALIGGAITWAVTR